MGTLMRKLPQLSLICATAVFFLNPGDIHAADNSGRKPLDEPGKQVIGGVDADINEIPFMGALVWNEESDNAQQFCTCTAISPYWVLTAAHCLDDITSLNEFKLVFGTPDLTDLEAGLVFYPKTFFLHPDHSKLYDDKYGDLALIQLSTPLPDWITPIALNGLESLETPGEKVRIAGWGRTSLETSSASDILQWAEVSLHDFESSNLSDFRKARVHGTLLAAGEIEPYRSTYSGDSGGPLMLYNNESEHWTQLGITSFSSGNKADNPVSFFTRVSSYKDWIEGIVDIDFHNWLGKWKIDQLFDQDLDGYQPALEWILGQNPLIADPDWTEYLELNISGTTPKIVLPLTMRDHLPRLFLELQTSSDLKQWNSIVFPSFDWERLPAEENGTSIYKVSLTAENIPGNFYRLKLQDLRGIFHGPLPLRMGKPIFGSLGKAYHDTGIDPNGLIRYDFLLDTFGFSDPVYIHINTQVLKNIWIYNLDTGSKVTEFLSTQTSSIELIPDEGQNYLLRVERSAGQSRTQSPLHVYADFKPGPKVYSLGETISGSLTHDDQPYVRAGYYADRYYFDLPIDKMFKVTMNSEGLDSTIVIKSDTGFLAVEEFDEEAPGVTEEALVYTRTFAYTEILAGSWRFEETGDYSLFVEEYEEPNEVRPGDDFLGMTDIKDRSSSQNGTTFRLDDFDIKGFDATEGITITVDGVEDHSIAFAIVDLTEKKTVHQTGSSTDLIGYFFNPDAGHEYGLVVISRQQYLGKNFRVKAYNGNFFNPDGSNDEPETTFSGDPGINQPS